MVVWSDGKLIKYGRPPWIKLYFYGNKLKTYLHKFNYEMKGLNNKGEL